MKPTVARADESERRARLRHVGGFVLGGVLALLTDMAMLRLLTDAAGLGPLIARPVSIAVAMVVSWLVHRTVTFRVTQSPTLAEFGRFAAVSWIAQAVNYGVFSVILIVRPATVQELALVLASLVSMIVAYLGFRFGVFRAPPAAPGADR